MWATPLHLHHLLKFVKELVVRGKFPRLVFALALANCGYHDLLVDIYPAAYFHFLIETDFGRVGKGNFTPSLSQNRT